MAFFALNSDATAIIGEFARPQPGMAGYAELEDSDARVIAFRTPAASKIYQAVDFIGRVTDGEYGAVIQLATTNIQVARWVDTLRIRGYIDVLDATAQAAKAGLVQLGAMTQQRADVIFS